MTTKIPKDKIEDMIDRIGLYFGDEINQLIKAAVKKLYNGGGRLTFEVHDKKVYIDLSFENEYLMSTGKEREDGNDRCENTGA